MNASQPAAAYPPPAKKGFPWGCLIGGCLTVVVLMSVAIFVAGFAGYRFYRAQLTKYTSDTPVELPRVAVDEAKVAELKARLTAFRTAIDEGKSPEPLELTAEEINSLISGDENLRGHVFVRIGDGEVSADLSVPLDAIPGAKGRYFNGSVTVDVSLENGVLIVQLKDAVVKGEHVPEQIMQGIRQQNLAQEAYKDTESAEFLRRFESLVVKDDKIVLTPTRRGEVPVSPASQGAAAGSGTSPDGVSAEATSDQELLEAAPR